ncbi:MAG TPA: hypothetical protein DCP89_02830 [Acidimicrobiaceae bacterium]|nr:hypothetical protein [Acidimicrobiaceae bacterium]
MLSYFRAVGMVLFGSAYYRQLPLDLFGSGVATLFALFLTGTFVAGGIGITNERKWGYIFALFSACYSVLATLWVGINFSLGMGFLLRLMFDIVLVVLLVHPHSRSYKKIWFR